MDTNTKTLAAIRTRIMNRTPSLTVLIKQDGEIIHRISTKPQLDEDGVPYRHTLGGIKNMAAMWATIPNHTIELED